MDDKRLLYLDTVAAYGSISKAAEKLYITASALSKYVQKAEDELGVRLFDRMGKRFVLTYAGERYLAWLKRINSIENDMLLEMGELANAQAGRIRVGIPRSGSERIVNDILPEFYAAFPKMAVEIIVSHSKRLRESLAEGRVDYIFIPDRYLSGIMKSEYLRDIHAVVALPYAHPAVEKAVLREEFKYPWIDLRELKDERFLAPEKNSDTFGVLSAMNERWGFEPYIVHQTEYFSSTLVNCVAKGLGVAFCTDQFVLGHMERGELSVLSYGDRSFYHELVIAYHKNHYVDKAARCFIELCKKAYK